MLYYYYKFNLKLENSPWLGTKACKYKILKSPQWLRNIKDKKYPFWRLDILFSKIYDWYSFNILPRLGSILANDSESYQYLAESIRMHPDQESLKDMILDAGFNKCKFYNLVNGIVCIHVAYEK
mgnify:CR=1 FL=1